MSLQDVDIYEDRRRPYIWGGQYNVSASDYGRLVNACNAAEYAAYQTSISAGQVLYGYSGEPVVIAAAEEYDPAFVDRVLKADAAANEATFDNVIDLMDWLERD